MKNYYSVFFYLFIVDSSHIRNQNHPSCRNCIHFKPDFTGCMINGLSKCNKLGSKDIVSNKIINDYAEHCRKSNDKCGLEGKFFELNKYSDLKYLFIYIAQLLNLYPVVTLLAFYLSAKLPKI